MGLCFTTLLSPSDPTSTSLKSPHFSDGASGSIDDGGSQSKQLVAAAAPHGHILERPNLMVFSFEELKLTTKNFKSDTLLSEGVFGRVYKGFVRVKSGTVMALAIKKLNPGRFDEWQGFVRVKSGMVMALTIKKLNLGRFDEWQGFVRVKSGTVMALAIKKLNPGRFDEWQSEVYFLGRLSHPNLVKLLGYCWDDDELLLVYEFLPKGSLKNHLFRRNHNIEPLSWNIRIKIAIGAARGLAFLHTLEKPIIHRDFKASSILLDVNYNAKISNFGLARLGPSAGESHVSTRVMGTSGYGDPEYMKTGHLNVKTDVYGFGVVLLQMLTGMRVFDIKRPAGQHNLIEWVRPYLYHENKFKTIMDARIEGQYSFKAALQAKQLTLKCLDNGPKNRPSMKDVVEALEGIEAIQDNSKESKNPNKRSSALQHP